MWSRVKGLRVQGVGFSIWGLSFRVEGVGLKDEGVWGSGFTVGRVLGCGA